MKLGLSRDQVKDLAGDFMMELMSSGVDQQVLCRMIERAVSRMSEIEPWTDRGFDAGAYKISVQRKMVHGVAIFVGTAKEFPNIITYENNWQDCYFEVVELITALYHARVGQFPHPDLGLDEYDSSETSFPGENLIQSREEILLTSVEARERILPRDEACDAKVIGEILRNMDARGKSAAADVIHSLLWRTVLLENRASYLAKQYMRSISNGK